MKRIHVRNYADFECRKMIRSTKAFHVAQFDIELSTLETVVKA